MKKSKLREYIHIDRNTDLDNNDVCFRATLLVKSQKLMTSEEIQGMNYLMVNQHSNRFQEHIENNLLNNLTDLIYGDIKEELFQLLNFINTTNILCDDSMYAKTHERITKLLQLCKI